jgi:hypothetical protein
MQLNFACVCPGTGEERAKPGPRAAIVKKLFALMGCFCKN